MIRLAMTRTCHHRDVVLALAVSVLCVAAACSADEQQAAPLVTTTAGALSLTFASDPNPPRTGENTVKVVVKNADGTPVTDAAVSAVFSMPAMPSMNMPEMRDTAPLESRGEGMYQGTGQLSMAGTWNVSITVARGSEQLRSRSFSVIVK